MTESWGSRYPVHTGNGDLFQQQEAEATSIRNARNYDSFSEQFGYELSSSTIDPNCPTHPNTERNFRAMNQTTSLAHYDRDVYDKITDVVQFLKEFGRSIALSKMFGIDTEAQGQILAMECMTRKCTPLTLAERYHFIFGKLSMKAETMLADFRTKMGGDFKIIERSAERAEIELMWNGMPNRFSISWADVQKEPFVYEGKEKEVLAKLAAKKPVEMKTKYQTSRGRMQMLWARLVSDSIRALCPEVVSGSYTPEEIEDFDEYQEQPAKGKRQQTTVQSSIVTEQPKSSPAATNATTSTKTVDAEVIDANEMVSADQINTITQLLERIQPTQEQIENMQAKRAVSNWRQLTKDQAVELIDRLLALIAQRESEVEQTANQSVNQQTNQPVNQDSEPSADDITDPTADEFPPREEAPVMSVRDDSPATAEQIATIKSLAKEIEQNQPGFSSKLGRKILESGLQRFADLTVAEAQDLIGQLGLKNISAFIESTLVGHAKHAEQGGQQGNQQAESEQEQPTAAA